MTGDLAGLGRWLGVLERLAGAARVVGLAVQVSPGQSTAAGQVPGLVSLEVTLEPGWAARLAGALEALGTARAAGIPLAPAAGDVGEIALMIDALIEAIGATENMARASETEGGIDG